MKKSVIMVLVAIVMVMVMQAGVFAAPAGDIMTALKATDAPVVYFSQVEAYLTSRTITSAQAAAVIAHIQNADAIAAGVTKFSMLSSAQDIAIFKEIAAAAQDLELTATYDGTTLLIKDGTGRTVMSISDSEVIKDTGHDYSIILAGAGLLVLGGMAALGMTIRKQRVSRQR